MKIRKLRILFLEPQPCIRALKYGKALKSFLGSKVSLCFGYLKHSLSTIYGYGNEYFERVVKLDRDEIDQSVRRIIDDFKPSLIHSHNAPNTLTLSAINVSGDIPVIHDVHEVLSIHNSGFTAGDDEEILSRYQEEERRANEESDGRIYATEGIKEYIHQQYTVPATNDLVFPNYVSKSTMPRHIPEKLSERDGAVHIVYIGCVTSLVEGSHYDLQQIFKGIASRGLHIHIYPTNNLITQSNDVYRKLADSNEFIHFHGNMTRKKLLHVMTQYDFGWAGFNEAKNRKHLDIVLPNKVMEYVACGLPVLAFPHATIQKFIESYGVGLVFDQLDTLEELLRNADLFTIRENVLNSRHWIAIEDQIPRLVDFYDQLVGRELKLPTKNQEPRGSTLLREVIG